MMYSESEGVEPGDAYYLNSLRRAIVNRDYLWSKYKKSLDMDSLLDRRNEALARLNEKLDRVAKMLDGHDCHCGGECKRCQEDQVCSSISRKLLALDKEHTQALAEVKGTKSLSSAGQWEAKARLSAIVEERQGLIRELCLLCPHSPECRL